MRRASGGYGPHQGVARIAFGAALRNPPAAAVVVGAGVQPAGGDLGPRPESIEETRA